MSRRKKVVIAALAMLCGSVVILANQLIILNDGLSSLASLMLAKNASSEEIKKGDAAIHTMKATCSGLLTSTQQLHTLVSIQKTLELKEISHNLCTIVNDLEIILGRKKEQHYVVFFLNNRELRPGGGFIGSLAFVTMHNYSMVELEIKDVYEIDGQIVDHFLPHPAVAKYLQVPHLFLRDSNFSPDFKTNVKTAGALLSAAGHNQPIDGAVGITTSAIEEIIGVLGTIYLPDFNQSITKDNFYIVTQSTVEKEFFPGSIQKRSFLSSLAKGIFLQLETANKQQLVKILYKNLASKHIVLTSRLTDVEKKLIQLNWSGELRQPTGDYIFPVEANVGANKANYFVQRGIKYSTKLSKATDNAHEFSIRWKNDSPNDSFLGGKYNNYFQLYLPRNIYGVRMSIDNEDTNDFDVSQTQTHTIVSTYIAIDPKETKQLHIRYASPEYNTGDAPYSLTIQKQIGSQNSDIAVNINGSHLIKNVSESFSLKEDIVIASQEN